MGGRVEVVAYGAPAFEALVGAVDEAKHGEPLAPVTVVAASPRSGSHLRRRLAAGRGYANIRICVLADLAATIGEDRLLAAGRRRLTRTALLAAVRGTLDAGAGSLAQVAAHPSTAVELAERYEELRDAGPEACARLAARPGVVAELATIVAAVRRRLEPGWFDDVDVMDAAVEGADAGGVPLGLGSVVVHLPERTAPRGRALLASLAGRMPVLVQVGSVGDLAADRAVHELVELLASDGFRLAGGARRAPGRDGGAPGDPEAVRDTAGALAARSPVPLDRLLAAADAGSEVRAAVRLVVEQLEAGEPADRCALLYPAAAPYRALLADVLGAAGIPWNGPSALRLGESPTARMLSGLLALAAGGPRLGRGAVVAWLASAPVVDRAGERVPVGEWDRCSRLAGVVDAEPAVFAARLRRHAGDLRGGSAGQDAAEGTDQAEGSLRSGLDPVRQVRDRRTVLACGAMAELLGDLSETLALGRAARTWRDLATWAARVLDRFLGRADERALWAHHAGAADVLVLEVLDELAELDCVDPAPDLARFAAALASACERPGPRPDAPRSGVVVGPLEAAAGLELDLVVVLGAVEGALPGRAAASSLLGPEDRALAGLDTAGPRRVVERDRRRLLVALAGARRRVVTVPARDSGDGRVLLRSRFLPGPAGEGVGAARAEELVPAFASVLARVAAGTAPAIDRTELECAALAAAVAPPDAHPVARAVPALGEGLRVVASRGAHVFDRFTGRAGSDASGAGSPAGTLGGQVLSPTSLEAYATCPFRYYLAHGLGCEVVDEPERRLEISPRDRGSMVHEVLEAFVGELITSAPSADGPRGSAQAGSAQAGSAQAGSAQAGSAQAGSAQAGSAERLAELAAGTFARYERLGLTGKAVLWEVERRRILGWLEAERVADEERRRAGSAPVAVELEFGFGDALPVLRHVGGRDLRFRGKVDRVDRADDGTVTVVDYKTGSSKGFAGLREDCVDRGRHLQLPLYALAASHAVGDAPAVRAEFRFVGDDPGEYPFDLAPDGLARLDEVLDVVAGSIDAGAFPFRPGAPGFGGYEHCARCDFARVCPVERAGLWEVARADASLAPYVALVEDASQADDT